MVLLISASQLSCRSVRAKPLARGGALQRPQAGRRVAGVAHRKLPHRLDKRGFEGLADLRHHDEALAGDAALAGIDHPRGGRDLGRAGDIDVLQDHIGVAAPELEDALLQNAAGLFHHPATEGWR